ncbi:MAG: low molecular weight protein arginine phosphatase [Tissierellaceae bacterium]
MNILFICTGNTCRSPMAEGILRELAKKKGLDIKVKSAGLVATEDGDISRDAISTLKDIGIDISDIRSKSVNEDLIKEADLILTMSQRHKGNLTLKYPYIREKIFLLNEYAFDMNKDVVDPFGMGRKYYEETRNEIYRAIEEILDSKY